MTRRPPGTFGVLRLLAGVALKQMVRAASIGAIKRRAARAAQHGAKRRSANPGKRRDGMTWLMVLMVPLFLFQATVMTGQAVRHLVEGVEAVQPQSLRGGTGEVASGLPDAGNLTAREHADLERIRARPRRIGLMAPFGAVHQPEQRALFAGAGSLLLLILLAALVAMGFGGGNASLAGGRWTQAWLMTFPVTTRSLVLAKALEYGLATLFPWFLMLPLSWQLLRALGQPGAFWVACVATLATTLLTGALRLWMETRLRLTQSLGTLRSVQGACTLFSLAAIGFLFVVGLGESTPRWFLDLAAQLPAPLLLLPAAWPMAIEPFGLLAPMAGVLATIVAFGFAVAATSRLLRHGSMQSGGVDSGVRGRAGRWRRAPRIGVIGKDLLLLLRDRNFLVQAVVLPMFIIGLNLFLNRGFERAAGRSVVLIAYGAGAFAVTRSCFQVLGAEGRALWMLFSLPVELGEIVRRKLRIWSGVGLCFTATALIAFAVRDSQPISWWRLGTDFLAAAFGVVCAAHIAGSIGMLAGIGSDGQADRQPKQRHAWLYMFFAGSYCVGLSASSLAGQLAGALVFATLTFAMWQRAVDRLPWLLDPVEEPKRLLSLFDGAAAVMVFFLLQALVAVLMSIGEQGGVITTSKLLVAFVLAGVGALLMFFVSLSGRGVDLAAHLRLRVQNGGHAVRALLLGAVVGLGLGLLGYLYVQWLRTAGDAAWFDLPAAEPADTALILLAVLAAPVIEELLFRGLVFGGLVRTVRPWLAVLWSAALFAVVHPVHSWLPVCLVGVAAALVVHRTGFLPAAILLHAAYNAMVICL